jgi:hypothetical protein
MSTRLIHVHAMALVALSAIMVTTANAQSGTRRARASTRIPVTKQPPVPDSTKETPPPANNPPPVVSEPAPAPVVTRTTTTTPAPLPPMRVRRYGNGFYIGLGGGASIPTQSIRNGYNPGYTVVVPIGWDAPLAPLGFRVNLGYTRFDARSNFRDPIATPVTAALATADPQVWSAIADLKLRMPFFDSWFGRTSSIYAVGGGGVNHFRNFNTTFARTNPEFSDPGAAPTTSESLTRAALNAGGGIAWGFRATEVFLESRYVTTFMPHERASYVPIVLGVNFY